MPGVEAAGAVGHCLPLTEGMCWGETLHAEGFPRPQGEVPPVTGMRLATPGYFRTMGIPVRGRGFRSGDGASGGPVVVLSQAAARAYFPGVDALGRRVRISGDSAWSTVVGIARDVRSKAETDQYERVLYQPIAAVARGAKARPMAYVLRTAVPPTSLLPAVRRAVADLDPSLPLAQVETLRSRIDRATAPTAFALTHIGLAAAIALLLGAVGVYAVVAYAVSQRTVEIGVRLALGARPADVLRLVMRQGGAVVGAGIAAGLVAAAALTRLMSGMLYGVHPFDPLSYAALTALMLGVAALALWFPARRAARLDPWRRSARTEDGGGRRPPRRHGAGRQARRQLAAATFAREPSSKLRDGPARGGPSGRPAVERRQWENGRGTSGWPSACCGAGPASP